MQELPKKKHDPLRGWQVRSGDLAEPLELAAGDIVTYTIKEGADGKDGRISGGWPQPVGDPGVAHGA